LAAACVKLKMKVKLVGRPMNFAMVSVRIRVGVRVRVRPQVDARYLVKRCVKCSGYIICTTLCVYNIGRLIIVFSCLPLAPSPLHTCVSTASPTVL